MCINLRRNVCDVTQKKTMSYSHNQILKTGHNFREANFIGAAGSLQDSLLGLIS